MLKTRLLTENDYEKLVSWWKANRFPAPAQEMLPQNGTGGIMVTKNGVDICAGFLYTTNSKIAWLEFIVANFEYRDNDRKEAIKLTISSLCQIAKDIGFKAVFTSVKHPSLINHFKDVGFSLDTDKSCEMVITLQ